MRKSGLEILQRGVRTMEKILSTIWVRPGKLGK